MAKLTKISIGRAAYFMSVQVGLLSLGPLSVQGDMMPLIFRQIHPLPPITPTLLVLILCVTSIIALSCTAHAMDRFEIEHIPVLPIDMTTWANKPTLDVLPAKLPNVGPTLLRSILLQVILWLTTHAAICLSTCLMCLAAIWVKSQRNLSRDVWALRLEVCKLAPLNATQFHGLATWRAPFDMCIRQQVQNLKVTVSEQRRILHSDAMFQKALLEDANHRTRNKLQLILSMINLQRRRAAAQVGKDGLDQLKDQVLALATVHNSLLVTHRQDMVDVAEILTELCIQTGHANSPDGTQPELSISAQPLLLAQNRVLPLALLATEAMTNAHKHCFIPEVVFRVTDQKIRMRLWIEPEDKTAHLEISNPTRAMRISQDDTGTGRTLIKTFATQLGGYVSQEVHDGRYILQASFPVRVPKEDTHIWPPECAMFKQAKPTI